MVRTVILLSIGVGGVACLLLVLGRRLGRRRPVGSPVVPPAAVGARPVHTAPGAPVAAGAPGAALRPPADTEARRRRNNGPSHFARPSANTRTIGRTTMIR